MAGSEASGASALATPAPPSAGLSDPAGIVYSSRGKFPENDTPDPGNSGGPKAIAHPSSRPGRIRLAIAFLVYASGLSFLVSLLRRRCACVLAYHAVDDPETSRIYPNNCVPAPAFERQMRYLARRRRVVPLDVLVGALRAGRPFPARAAAVTFDDGYRTVYTRALPILKGLSLPAHLYLVTDRTADGRPKWDDLLSDRLWRLRGRELETAGVRLPLRSHADYERASLALVARVIEGPSVRDEVLARLGEQAGPDAIERNLLTWEECREMARAGFTFGSHTASHLPLHPRARGEAAEEIRRSKEAIERALGAPARHFCPPLGQEPPDLRALLAAEGFESAIGPRKGLLRPGDDPFALRRVSPRYFEPHFLFVMRVHGSYEWIDRAASALRRLGRRLAGR